MHKIHEMSCKWKNESSVIKEVSEEIIQNFSVELVVKNLHDNAGDLKIGI